MSSHMNRGLEARIRTLETETQTLKHQLTSIQAATPREAEAALWDTYRKVNQALRQGDITEATAKRRLKEAIDRYAEAKHAAGTTTIIARLEGMHAALDVLDNQIRRLAKCLDIYLPPKARDDSWWCTIDGADN